MGRFLVLVVTTLVVAILYDLVVFRAPEFFETEASPQAVRYLDRMPNEAVQRMKLRVGKADIGLFGNSRAMMVGGRDIGLGDCRFFNYTVSGSSLRNSVALLEILTESQRAPGIAVVSLDHFEIGMMGHPEYLPLPQMLSLAAADIGSVIGEPKVAARVAFRHLYVVWGKFRRAISSSYFPRVVDFVLGQDPRDGRPYLVDGSRVAEEKAGATADHAFHPAAGEEIIDSLLVRDLERLKAMEGAPGGPSKIIVYESPLNPENAARYADAATPGAARHRAVAARVCGDLGLSCHLGGVYPTVIGAASDAAWSDASHAPAAALGPFIRELVGPVACTGTGS